MILYENSIALLILKSTYFTKIVLNYFLYGYLGWYELKDILPYTYDRPPVAFKNLNMFYNIQLHNVYIIKPEATAYNPLKEYNSQSYFIYDFMIALKLAHFPYSNYANSSPHPHFIYSLSMQNLWRIFR